MATTVWNVMRSLAGMESGRWCRGCGDSIARADGFGLSEGVCRPCRVGSPESR
jgi:hypothetical protein